MSSITLSPGLVQRRAINPWIVAVAVVISTFMEVLVAAVVDVVLAFLVLLMRRSVAEKGAHLGAE